MKTFEKFLKSNINESFMMRLVRKYNDCDSGTISAYCGDVDDNANETRSLQLKTELIRKGYSVTELMGKYNLSDNNSIQEKIFLVFDITMSGVLKDVLIDLGKKYSQDYITFNSVQENQYYLVDLKNGNSLKLEVPLIDVNGNFNKSIKDSPYVFETHGTSKFSYDCTKISYDLMTNLNLSNPDFVLVE